MVVGAEAGWAGKVGTLSGAMLAPSAPNPTIRLEICLLSAAGSAFPSSSTPEYIANYPTMTVPWAICPYMFSALLSPMGTGQYRAHQARSWAIGQKELYMTFCRCILFNKNYISFIYACLCWKMSGINETGQPAPFSDMTNSLGELYESKSEIAQAVPGCVGGRHSRAAGHQGVHGYPCLVLLVTRSELMFHHGPAQATVSRATTAEFLDSTGGAECESLRLDFYSGIESNGPTRWGDFDGNHDVENRLHQTSAGPVRMAGRIGNRTLDGGLIAGWLSCFFFFFMTGSAFGVRNKQMAGYAILFPNQPP